MNRRHKNARRQSGAARIAYLAACFSFAAAGCIASEARAQDGFHVSADRIAEHTRYLSGDELAGRAPGSLGEALAIAYLEKQFRLSGAAPGNPDGTFVQEVPLVGATLVDEPELVITTQRETLRPAYGTDFMSWTLRQDDSAVIDDGDMIFVGYGVTAPEYGWNDYRDADVTGKVVVMLVGDPPLDDTTRFAGNAMTYYGRWTYKFEHAAEMGATGALLVHNSAAAGYPWEVVANSWSGEQFDVVRSDSGQSRCRVEGWITESTAIRLFASTGRSFDEAVAEALDAGFRAMPLGAKASARVNALRRRIISHNVVARFEGRDPNARHDHVIYSAHWDHLGVGNAVEGDSIYNGALDNASGVAAILEIARAVGSRRDELRRSVLFLITTAEESGLLGARHYVLHPLYPIARALAIVNVDGVNVWGPTRDMIVVGYGQTTLEDDLGAALSGEGRRIVPDTEPEKGYYYRSDHFPFAKQGVPALYSDSGCDFVGKPPGWGLEMRKRYARSLYHKPGDEFDETWDFSGAAQDMEALLAVGFGLAASDRVPRWHDTSEFKNVRNVGTGAR